MYIRKDIRNADEILHKVSCKIPFSTVTPSNEQKVRNDFLKGKVKNPILEYDLPDADLFQMRRLASSFTLEEKDGLDTIMIEKQHDLIKKIDLINSIGCFDFTDKSKKLYGLPSKSLVKKAMRILESDGKKTKSPKMLAKDAIQLLRTNLKANGLKYTVARKTLVGSANVEPSHHRIELKKKARFSRHYMNRLVVHEIGTHIFRYENGALQDLKVFSHGLSDYLGTEEGLALFMEEQYGLYKSPRNTAGLVLAVHLAQYNDFYSVFQQVNQYFPPKQAFRLTLRAKRGLRDTSQHGGFTKDYLYLDGYFNVKRYIKNGGDVRSLYVGKVALKDLDHLAKLSLKKPKYLPTSFILTTPEGTETVERKIS